LKYRRLLYASKRLKGEIMRFGSTELLLLVVLAIILFGGSRIAGLGKALGKSIREFKEEVHTENQPAKPDNDKDTPEA
jgi:sec-independent protein translocase protein TatA